MLDYKCLGSDNRLLSFLFYESPSKYPLPHHQPYLKLLDPNLYGMQKKQVCPKAKIPFLTEQAEYNIVLFQSDWFGVTSLTVLQDFINGVPYTRLVESVVETERYRLQGRESKLDGHHVFGPRCIIKKHMEHCPEHNIWRKYGDPWETYEGIGRADLRRQEQEKKKIEQQQEKAQEAVWARKFL
ncbi:hypothetical protein HO133_005583 [Letharia lupina]|uniref:Uncharacterized protein n=1 Tax=Letharia lupina TaxID=560253 RepID=A0A8H6C9A8_9LECA|nr:uncharacterized protein HO133_005583 [Letharia lupina]KAF6219039.1 hypothetical protein HO133_005583 [Letharia lupina]